MKLREKTVALVMVFCAFVAMGIFSPCLAHEVGDDIDIKPKTLGAVCKKALITVTWDLPDGYGPGHVLPEEIIITEVGGYPAGDIPPVSYKFKRHGDDWHLLLRYDCSEVLDVITTNNLKGEVLVEISGTLSDGSSFIGWDDIYVKRKRVR